MKIADVDPPLQTLVQNNTQCAGAALLDRIGPIIIITHSQAGSLGCLIAAARPSLVKALVSLEPSGPPFEDRVTTNSTTIVRPYGITNIPVTYDPPIDIDGGVGGSIILSRVTVPATAPGKSDSILQASPARRLVNLSILPHLIQTSEASYHAVYDYCTVLYLRQAGVAAVDHFDLPNLGIHRNTHFIFLEKNNLEVAGRVETWIRGKING